MVLEYLEIFLHLLMRHVLFSPFKLHLLINYSFGFIPTPSSFLPSYSNISPSRVWVSQISHSHSFRIQRKWRFGRLVLWLSLFKYFSGFFVVVIWVCVNSIF
jgi:hypothetical protein